MTDTTTLTCKCGAKNVRPLPYGMLNPVDWCHACGMLFGDGDREPRYMPGYPLSGVARQDGSAGVEPFQSRVKPWMLECFNAEIAADKIERSDRAVEEMLELSQAVCASVGVDFAPRAHALVDYVAGRPVGEAHQEVGGVMVTLAALCLACDLDMHEAGETELARINVPETIAKIRAKQAAAGMREAITITPGMVEAACQARCTIPGVHWADGLSEGIARIEMMLAEKMLEAALTTEPKS